MDKEIWKAVPNYEGIYEASSHGRIRSLDREITDKRAGVRRIKGRTLKTENKVNGAGYQGVSLCNSGIKEDFSVHQIIAQTFLEHEPKGYEKVVNHIDGDRLNNKVENLEIVTVRENTSVKFRKNSEKFSSSHVGVSYSARVGKWKVTIGFKGKGVHLGYFDCERDGSDAYQTALSKINNNEFSPSAYAPIYSCKSNGVHIGKEHLVNKYIAFIGFGGKSYNLGSFPTEDIAYKARLKAESEIASGTFLQLRAHKNKTAK